MSRRRAVRGQVAASLSAPSQAPTAGPRKVLAWQLLWLFFRNGVYRRFGRRITCRLGSEQRSGGRSKQGRGLQRAFPTGVWMRQTPNASGCRGRVANSDAAPVRVIRLRERRERRARRAALGEGPREANERADWDVGKHVRGRPFSLAYRSTAGVGAAATFEPVAVVLWWRAFRELAQNRR